MQHVVGNSFGFKSVSNVSRFTSIGIVERVRDRSFRSSVVTSLLSEKRFVILNTGVNSPFSAVFSPESLLKVRKRNNKQQRGSAKTDSKEQIPS